MAAQPTPVSKPAIRPPTAKNRDWVLSTAYALTFLIVAILVVVPVGALLYGSFRTSAPGRPGQWTLQNYVGLLSSGTLGTFVNTLVIAVATAITSTLGGAVMTWIVCRTDFRYRSLATILIGLTFYLPGFIMAMAWIILGSPAGLFNTLLQHLGINSQITLYNRTGMVWVMTLHILPFVFLTLRGPMMSIDTALEEAAKMSGASPWRVITRITLPLMLFSMLSSFLLVFVMGVEQFAIPVLLGFPSHTYVLATQLYLFVATPPPHYGLAATVGLMLSLLTGLTVFIQRKVVSRIDMTSVTGKAYRPMLIPLGRWRWLANLCIFGYLLLALVLPGVILIYTSLLRFFTFDLANAHFTLDHFKFVFTNASSTRAFWNTLYVSASGAVIGLVLGTLTSYFVHKVKPGGYRLLDFLSALPFGVPGIVIGLGFLWGYIQTPIYGTIWLLVMSYVTRYLPYATETVGGQMIQLDNSLEEAAWSCGSTRLGSFRKIVLPLIMPSIQSGWFLLFMAFFREISSAVLVYTAKTQMVPILIWTYFEQASWGRASALSLVSTVIVFVMMIFIQNVLPKLRASKQ